MRPHTVSEKRTAAGAHSNRVLDLLTPDFHFIAPSSGRCMRIPRNQPRSRRRFTEGGLKRRFAWRETPEALSYVAYELAVYTQEPVIYKRILGTQCAGRPFSIGARRAVLSLRC